MMENRFRKKLEELGLKEAVRIGSCTAFDYGGMGVFYSIDECKYGLCHVLSFIEAKDGKWYKPLLQKVKESFGKPEGSMLHDGIRYYFWKKVDEA